MKLEYSELTDKVYIGSGKNKKDVTQDFFHCLFGMIETGSSLTIDRGKGKGSSLIVNCDLSKEKDISINLVNRGFDNFYKESQL